MRLVGNFQFASRLALTALAKGKQANTQLPFNGDAVMFGLHTWPFTAVIKIVHVQKESKPGNSSICS